jgi:uncharacterized Ntn-hydrolase superfamily protein
MIMIPIATFSIVAYDPEEVAWGVAVASKFPAVGNVVPWARAGAGAVATQSYANPTYGPLGLDLMENGMSAPRFRSFWRRSAQQRSGWFGRCFG